MKNNLHPILFSISIDYTQKIHNSQAFSEELCNKYCGHMNIIEYVII